jgi:uncharacterized protein (DUF302 family)
MKQSEYYYSTDLKIDFDTALKHTTDALAGEGFGVLSDIDVQHTLKEKLDADFRRYRILGACNPPLAHRGLAEEPDLGVLLPCNFVVYELGPEATRVSAMDPSSVMKVVDNEKVSSVAVEVSARIKTVMDAIEVAAKA